MGGGVGFINGVKYCIVIECMKWVMLEMNIGFFLDVGVVYFLNKVFGYIGWFVVLIVFILKVFDVLFINVVDYFMIFDLLLEFFIEFESVNWYKEDDVYINLKEVICIFVIVLNLESEFVFLLEVINLYFVFDIIEEIIYLLEKDESFFVLKMKEILLLKFFILLKVILK